MTKSEKIRRLAAEGVATAEIARRLGIRYQHAYNVLKQAGSSGVERKTTTTLREAIARARKPQLLASELIDGGFSHVGRWLLSESNRLQIEGQIPRGPGVYAFSLGGRVQYVGLASNGLAQRLYFYSKPGSTQETNIRLNATMKEVLSRVTSIEILTAEPDDQAWNGLPINSAAGLELGIIKKYDLPWNKRSN